MLIIYSFCKSIAVNYLILQKQSRKLHELYPIKGFESEYLDLNGL
jgi:hypothetical protein